MRRLITVALLALLLPALAQAQLSTVDAGPGGFGAGGAPPPTSIAFQSTGFVSGTQSTYNVNVTVGSAAGQERLVGLGCISQGLATDRTISAVTVDGQTATAVVGARSASTFSGGDGTISEFWRVSGTSGTTITVAVTLNGNCFSMYAAVWTLTSVGTLTQTVHNETQITSNLNINTTTGGVMAAITTSFSDASAAWTGATENFDQLPAFGDDLWSGASDNVVAGSTPLILNVVRTPSGGGEINPSAVAVSFAP